MEKLQFKHLTLYLPHKLMIGAGKDLRRVELTGLMSETGYSKEPICIIMDEGDEYYISDVKPILRPIEDLTQEIEINGEKTTPYDFAKKIVSEDQWENICNMILYQEEYQKICDMPYWWVEFLFKNHFDVYGLIKKGLAIDLNTI